MRLILVRHGQTPANVGRLLDTAAPGADLTELGREQARALTDVLADEPVEAVYASTLVRTQQTAAPLAERLALTVEVRDGLREVTAGDLEMLGDDESIEQYLGAVFAWSEGDLGRAVPGGEVGTDVYRRYDAVVAEIAASGVRTAVAVSHGAVIRSWVAARTDNVSTEHVETHGLGNTGVVVLEGSPEEGWRAVTWEGRAVGGPDVEAPGQAGAAAERLPR